MKRRLSFFLLTAFLFSTTSAQPVTITDADFRARFNEGDFAYQLFAAGYGFGEMTPEDSLELQNKMMNLLDQVSEGGTYDFTDIDFEQFASTVLEVQELPVEEDVPGAAVFNETNAEFVFSNFGLFGGTIYTYVGIEEDGMYLYGTAEAGEEPVIYDEPVLDMALPLELGSSWSKVTEQVFFGVTTRDSTYSEVVGYGQIVTPGGTAPGLVVRQQNFSEILTITDTTETFTFWSKDMRLSASISVNAEGVPEGIVYSVESDESSEPADVASGFVGEVLSELGLTIELTDASATDGMIRAFRIGYIPPSNSFSGSATAGNGSEVMPDVIVSNSYYVVSATDVSSFEYGICLSYAGLSIDDAGVLVVLRREGAAEPWGALNTTVDADAQSVCASGLTSFSHFTIGANSDDVGTAIEEDDLPPAGFRLLGSTPNPAHGSATINYELSTSAHVTLRVYDALGRELRTVVDGWQQAGEQRAHVDVSDLPSGLYVYRLTADRVSQSKTLLIVK